MTRVLIRADASATIGNGHVMRCLALARGWRARGAQVRFACREHPGHLCERLERDGFEVQRLPMGVEPDRDGTAHAAWLGASQAEDAAAVGALLQAGPRPDWLVVDHYSLDRRWQDALRAQAGALLVIDDLADREHGPCLLLDQNLVADMHSRYAGRVADPSRWLLGPRFALLGEDFAALHARARLRDSAPRRLLLHLGGGPDPHDILGRALSAAMAAAGGGLEVDCVAGAARAESLRARFGDDPRLRVHAQLDSLAPLVAACDLAIGACGVAALERLCGGLPSLVVSMAENQRAGAEEMARRGLLRYLGHHDRVEDAQLGTALGQLLDALPDPAWSQRALAEVDGGGVARTLDAIAQGAPPPLRARPVVAADEAILLAWANDPLTRASAFSSAPIPLAEHQRWLRSRLSDAGCRFYVVEQADGPAIGSVRFQREPAGWEVHFALSPAARGRGLGRSMVAEGMRALRAETERSALVFGQVKNGNVASCRIFEQLGFESGEPLKPGTRMYRSPAAG